MCRPCVLGLVLLLCTSFQVRYSTFLLRSLSGYVLSLYYTRPRCELLGPPLLVFHGVLCVPTSFFIQECNISC